MKLFLKKVTQWYQYHQPGYEKELENPIPVPCWYVEKSKPDQDGFTGPVTTLID
jgi:hypothetical protein